MKHGNECMSVSGASAVDKGIMPGALGAIAQLTLSSSTSDEPEPSDALATGSEDDPDNYRPISIISVVYTLFSRLLTKNVNNA